MAASQWGTSPPLEDRLFSEAYLFEFFQAVRLALRLHPEAEGIGQFSQPSREAVRLSSDVSLASPASVIRQISQHPPYRIKLATRVPIYMSVASWGLAGFGGILPLYFTELMIEARRRRKYELLQFIDMFNHRLLSLEYRAWEKHRLIVSAEREPSFDVASLGVPHHLMSLMGLGINPNRQRLEVPDRILLRYSGLLLPRPRSASGLSTLLTDYFRFRVTVDQFVGAWSALAASEWARLGARGESNELGGGAILGNSVWYAQATFALKTEPLPFKRFGEFLPGGQPFGELTDLTDHFTEGRFGEFYVRLGLDSAEAPDCKIGPPTPGVTRVRLGWTTWLKGARTEPGETSHSLFVRFSSHEPVARLRHELLVALRNLASELEPKYKIKLAWSDEVVPFACDLVPDKRSRAKGVAEIIGEIRRLTEGELNLRTDAPRRVLIRVESGKFTCELI